LAKNGPIVRDPEDMRRRLVAAALNVFAARGYASATVAEIVQQAGCSKGAFYTHFASKEALFLALLESRLKRNHQRLLELCPWEGNCGQWLTNVFATLVGFAAQDESWRVLSVEFMAHGMRNPQIGARIGLMHQDFRRIVAETLRRGPEFRQGPQRLDPEAVAACVGALIDGLVIQSSLEPAELPIATLGKRVEPLLQAWFGEA